MNARTKRSRIGRVVRYIDGHPEEWDQKNWNFRHEVDGAAEPGSECGTACCVAGHAVLLLRGRAALRDLDSSMVYVEARDLLWLTNVGANYLFGTRRTLRQLKNFARTQRVPRAWRRAVGEYAESVWPAIST